MNLTLDGHRYFALPEEVRESFTAWSRAEGIDGAIVDLTLGEGFVSITRLVRNVDGLYHLGADGEIVTEHVVFPVRTLPPMEAFAP